MDVVSKNVKNNIELYRNSEEKFLLEECQNMIFNLQGQLKAAQRELKNEIERKNNESSL